MLPLVVEAGVATGWVAAGVDVVVSGTTDAWFVLVSAFAMVGEAAAGLGVLMAICWSWSLGG